MFFNEILVKNVFCFSKFNFWEIHFATSKLFEILVDAINQNKQHRFEQNAKLEIQKIGKSSTETKNKIEIRVKN